MLPSVFADALKDGVAFNSAVSSAAAVGDPGDSGGTFTLTAPDIAGGSVTLDPDSGILQWTPGTGCQAAAYPVTVTYTYSGGHQVRAFTLNTEATTMPPVFDLTYGPDSNALWHFESPGCGVAVCNDSYIAPSPYYYNISHSYAARGGQGVLTYSLSGNPPPGTELDPNTGQFTCDLALADPFTVYDFYVTVTDSAGQYERIHVLADKATCLEVGALGFAPDYPWAAGLNPWLVATDSTDNNLLPLTCPDDVVTCALFYPFSLTVHAWNLHPPRPEEVLHAVVELRAVERCPWKHRFLPPDPGLR